jgi:adenylate kinase family enzyme
MVNALGRGGHQRTRRRQDEAVIRKRIAEYEQKTAPLKEYYTRRQVPRHRWRGIDRGDHATAGEGDRVMVAER